MKKSKRRDTTRHLSAYRADHEAGFKERVYFTVQELRKTPYAQALRRALPRMTEREILTRSATKTAFNRLVAEKRYLCAHLASKKLIKPADYYFIMNCHPADTPIYPVTRTCKFQFICCFCWQRNVVAPIAHRILDPLTNYKTCLRDLGKDVRPWDLSVEYTLENRTYRVRSPREGAKLLRHLPSLHKSKIPGYAIGAQSLFTVIPDGEKWLAQRAVLVLGRTKDVPAKQRKNEHRHYYRCIHDAMSHRLDVAKLIAEACAYPEDWMPGELFEEDQPLEPFLRAKALAPKVRLKAMFGAFVGKSGRSECSSLVKE